MLFVKFPPWGREKEIEELPPRLGGLLAPARSFERFE
jgi:hypothetical protein